MSTGARWRSFSRLRRPGSAAMSGFYCRWRVKTPVLQKSVNQRAAASSLKETLPSPLYVSCLFPPDHQCKGREEDRGEEGVHCLLIWIPIVATVSLYSLIVTAVLVVSCVSHFRHHIIKTPYISFLSPSSQLSQCVDCCHDLLTSQPVAHVKL